MILVVPYWVGPGLGLVLGNVFGYLLGRGFR
jgi:hypothetical protein